MPTSTTTAPGRTMPASRNAGRPMATMRMSALRVIAGRSREREWQTVTVALPPGPSWRRRAAIGFPTMLERATITAWGPLASLPERVSICCPPSGGGGARGVGGGRLRLRDDVGAADDPGVGPLRLYPRADQHLLHAERGGGAEGGGVAHGELAHVHRVEAVHVLGGRNPEQHLPAVDLLRQGELDQETVDGGVGVQAVHLREQLRLGGAGGEPDRLGVHPRLATGVALALHVGAAGGVVPDDHHGESGLDPPPLELGHVAGDLVADRPGDRGAVEDPRAHRATPTARGSPMAGTLICPGFCSSVSIRRAMVSASSLACASSIFSGTTITRTSRPAWITLVFSTPSNAAAISSSLVSRFT